MKPWTVSNLFCERSTRWANIPNKFFLICLFLRETEHERGRGRERGRHRIGSRFQALSHQPRARRGARTRGPRDRDLSRSRTLNRLSHPGAPALQDFKNVHTWQRCICLQRFTLILPKFTSAFSSSVILPLCTLFDISKQNNLWKFLL